MGSCCSGQSLYPMNRKEFLRLIGFCSVGAAIYRPHAAWGAINYNFEGIPTGIRPYLQTPRPDSIWVCWWTDAASQAFVDYGVSSSDLNLTASGTVNAMGTNYRYHSVKLTGLQPNTYYHYRVRSESGTSEVFRFRTPKPLGTATGKFRLLIIGDNQIIDPAQRRYERLVERAKKKVEDLYGMPIEEAIDLVLLPGDQVDVGTLEHYRHLHFKYTGWISPSLPIMTTIGNHETYSDSGLANYKTIFKYDELNCLGVTSPDPKVYYAYQLANLTFVHTSSEHTGATQTAWVQNVVNAANASSSADWMISLCHRPYQAEQYIGDISGWLRNTAMPIFAQTEKHVLNIGAHHHLYARGQTRDWPVYHIISGGSAWDQYWGQSSEANYDDVQKTIANWAWQLVEFDLDARTMDVRCFAEANIRFPQATRWAYNSRLIDQFSRKRNLGAPNAPALTNSISAPVSLPLTLQSSAYTTATSEPLNTTWFQIATDAAFTDVKRSVIRDFESYYGDTGSPDFEPVNVNAGINILQYTIAAGGLANGTYHARVRHRDANTLWSNWSPALSFTVQGSATTGNPKITLAKTVFAPNENYQVVYENGPGNAKDWIGVYKKGQTPGGTGATEWKYVTSGSASNGSLSFTNDIAVGEWYAAFFTNDGYTEIAPRVPFYVGNQPVLAPGKAAYAEGETVVVNFSNAPGGATDWIGIYRVGTTPQVDGYAAYQYVGATSGAKSFANLPKGYYYACYFVNDGYFEIAARVNFSVGSEIAGVTMAGTQVTPGSSFKVNFTNGPGTPKDYIGIFRAGSTPGVGEEGTLIDYLYVGGTANGSVTFDIPNLPPGDYFLALYINDSYTEVSPRLNFSVAPQVPFRIEGPVLNGATMVLSWYSMNGATYQLQRVDSLGGTWQTIKTVTGNGTLMQESVTVDTRAKTKEFFRINKL